MPWLLNPANGSKHFFDDNKAAILTDTDRPAGSRWTVTTAPVGGYTPPNITPVTTEQLTAALATKANLSGGKLATAELPPLAIADYLGSVSNQVQMLALVGQRGDWCSRSDTGTVWLITGDTPSSLTSWRQLDYPAMKLASATDLDQTGAAPGKFPAVTQVSPLTFGLVSPPTLTDLGVDSTPVAIGDLVANPSQVRTPATDLATSLTLVNQLRAALLGLGVVAAAPGSVLDDFPWDLRLEGDNITGLTDGTDLATWTGIAGSATQATTGARPTYRSNQANAPLAKGHPVLEFANGDYLDSDTIATGPQTAFCVYRARTWAPYPAPLMDGQAVASLALQTPDGGGGIRADITETAAVGGYTTSPAVVPVNAWHVFGMRYEHPGAWQLWLDDLVVASGTSSNLTTAAAGKKRRFGKGANAGNGNIYVDGYYAAIFQRNAALTDAQFAAVGTALYQKYVAA